MPNLPADVAHTTDPSVLAGYLTDASNVRGSAEALFRPRSTAEVASILACARAEGVPILAVGGRTSTTAGAVPEGGWVMSLEALDQILDIGHAHASAQAGVLLGTFQQEIEASGRFYPPDPTSRFDCTLGASIACNASGARTFRYGPTRDWVEALEVALPTGEVLEVRRGDPIPAEWPVPSWSPPRGVKSAAGIEKPSSWIDLFIGTEGILGVITRATVRLTTLPAEVIGLVVWFPDRATTLSFVDYARRAARTHPNGDLSPRCLEYLDAHCLDLARARLGGVPDEARAGLFCEQEVTTDPDRHLTAWLEAAEQHGALARETLVALDAVTRGQLHTFRHAIPAGINEQVVRNGIRKIGTDLSVPDGALAEMMDLYERAPVPHVLFGHIGDNHLHLNLLPRTPTELAHALTFYDALAQRAIALGGSVSGEHGIGKLKRTHLEWMVGPAVLNEFRQLKRVLDPQHVLGRGNVLVAEPGL